MAYRTILSTHTIPTTVGNYSAAASGASITSLIRCAFDKSAPAGCGCAIFAVDDTTISSGSITGTFSASNPATWPNAGKGVRYLGQLTSPTYNTSTGNNPLALYEPTDAEWGPGYIVLRTATTGAASLFVSGVGDQAGATGTAFVEGGNAFGADGVCGTTDGSDMYIVAGSSAHNILKGTGNGVTTTLYANVNTPVFIADSTSTSLLDPASGFTFLLGSAAITSLSVGGMPFLQGDASGATLADPTTGLNLITGNGTSVAVGHLSAALVSVYVAAAGTFHCGDNATDHTSIFGSVTGASPTTVQGGVSGVQLQATAGGNVQIKPGATGNIVLNPRTVGAGNTAQLQFRELLANGNNYVGFQAPDALTGDQNYILPTALPTVTGQALTSNLTGTMSWANAIQSGVTSLTNGVSAAISANMTATTRIFLQVADQTPGAGNLTASYQPLAANRSNGLPGSFKVTACIDAGTINALDQTSTVMWMTINA